MAIWPNGITLGLALSRPGFETSSIQHFQIKESNGQDSNPNRRNQSVTSCCSTGFYTTCCVSKRQLAFLLPKVCICDRRPRLTAKRFQNGRPACSPESPDFMRRLQANELRLERRSELFLPAFFIGGAKGPGTSPLHGLKSKRQVVLVQAVRKQGVMIFQSWQLPVRVLQRPSTCWAKKFSKTMPKVSRLFPFSVLQINLLDCFRICVQVSVQERIISRAWPDVSHKKRLQQKAEVANPGPESGKTCQFASIL
ncbi:uncharacterized protein [Syngnathus scovelli]|uniref:uncharacterized protein isoform X8 n=1 Tax=Syngnathus scovelli TaxID=161590 RepID=UPI0035C94F9E